MIMNRPCYRMCFLKIINFYFYDNQSIQQSKHFLLVMGRPTALYIQYFLLLLHWLLLIPTASAYALTGANKVTNGDFESYVLTGTSPHYYNSSYGGPWYEASGLVYEIERIQSPPTVATQSCDLSSNYSNTLCQMPSLEINKIYQVSFNVVFKFASNPYTNVTLSVGNNVVLRVIGTVNNTNYTILSKGLIIFMASSSLLCVKEENPNNLSALQGPNVDNISIYELAENETFWASSFTKTDFYILFTPYIVQPNVILMTNYSMSTPTITTIFSKFTRVMIQDTEITSPLFKDTGGNLSIEVPIPAQHVNNTNLRIYVGLPTVNLRIMATWGALFGQVGPISTGIAFLSLQYLATNTTQFTIIPLPNITNTNTNTTANTTNATTNSSIINSTGNSTINGTNQTTNASVAINGTLNTTNSTVNNTNSIANTTTTHNTSTNSTNSTNMTIPQQTTYIDIHMKLNYQILEKQNLFIIDTNYVEIKNAKCYTQCLPLQVEDQIMQVIKATMSSVIGDPVSILNNGTNLGFTTTPTSIAPLFKLTTVLRQSSPLVINITNSSTLYRLIFQMDPTSVMMEPPYYYPLTEKEITYSEDTSTIYLAFVNAFKSFYPFLTSGLSSYFVVKLVCFWNLSFLYIYLPLRMMPAFMYNIILQIAELYYTDMNFIEFFKYLSTGIKFSYKIYLYPDQQQQLLQAIQTHKDKYLSRLIDQLNVSTDFVNNNIQDLSVIGFLIIKLCVLYWVCKKYSHKIQIVLKMDKVWYLLAIQVMVSLPFFILATFCKLLFMGSFAFLGKFNVLLHVLFMFILVALFALNFLNRYRESGIINPLAFSTKTIVEKIEQLHERLAFKTKCKRISNNFFLIEVFFCTIVPILLVIGNNTAFFVILISLTLYKTYYIIINRNIHSGWEFSVRLSMCFIWILYNFVWLALFLIEVEEMQGKHGPPSRYEGVKYCGYMIMFLLLLGGFIQLVALLADVVLTIFKCFKHIFELVCKKQSSLKHGKDAENIQSEKVGSRSVTRRQHINFSNQMSCKDFQFKVKQYGRDVKFEQRKIIITQSRSDTDSQLEQITINTPKRSTEASQKETKGESPKTSIQENIQKSTKKTFKTNNNINNHNINSLAFLNGSSNNNIPLSNALLNDLLRVSKDQDKLEEETSQLEYIPVEYNNIFSYN